MRLKAVLDFPRKVLRSVSRHGVAGTLRHGVRAFILQGGAARAEEVAELRAALSATRAEADAMREAIGGLDVRAAAIQAALDGREVPAPFDPAPLYRTQALHQEALEWLLEDAGAGGRPPAPRHGPLVSVILPVWNRAALVGEAIRSVQAQHYATWELLVVDDGSVDETAQVVRGFLSDPRIRCLRQEHRGQSAARNAALARARGEFVAYIDSDDLWYPSFLSRMIEAFAAAPERTCAYAAALMTGPEAGLRVLYLPTDRQQLLAGNSIPLIVFVHRRSLYGALGGFDESLARLVDWDLILRYTQAQPPLAVPTLGARYRLGTWPRVSSRESQALATCRVRAKHASRPADLPQRVLYALEFFPHLSETYVETEMSWARRLGIEVVAWSEHDPPVPYATPVKVHRGDLAGVLRCVSPDVMHVHHLYRALRYAPIAAAAGVPVTVRGHGFEFTEQAIAALAASDAIRTVYQFPHLAPASLGGGKVRPMSCCFDPELHYPEGEFDRRLVFRTALASPTKDLAMFIEVAARCPDHRFVLLACWSVGYPSHLDQLHALNRSLGSPVDIRVNRPHREAADLARRSAIYLHTHALQEPYGMPVSIAEAMAAGCHIVARHTDASAAFVGDAGRTYGTADEAAALIQATSAWTEDDWRLARLRSIDRAFSHFTAPDVLEPLLGTWRALAVTQLTRQGSGS